MTANASTRPALAGVYGIDEPGLPVPARPPAKSVVPGLDASETVLKLRRKFTPSDNAEQAQYILLQSKQRLSLPAVAIGGINADNGRSLITASHNRQRRRPDEKHRGPRRSVYSPR